MKSTKTKTFLGLLAGIFMVASLAAFFPSSSVHAADPTLKKEGCIGYESIGYKSPFSQTKDLCLGQGQASQYYQFAVKLKSAVSDAKVSAKNGNGLTLKFVKQDSTTYVSQEGDKEGMGYAAPLSRAVDTCNTKDKLNIVTITVTGNGKTQNIALNMCSYPKVEQSLVYQTADQITGDDGTVSKTGNIKGYLGILRDDPLVPEKWKKGTLEHDGVVSIKLSGKATKSGTNKDTWYTLAGGKLVIPNLDSGTYTLAMTYNDVPQVLSLPGDAAWTSSEIKLSYANIVVPPGGDVWIGGSLDDKISYFNVKGDAVTPTKTQESDESPTKCNVEGIGWILCPISNAMAGMTDSLMQGVTAFMKVAPLSLSPTDNPLYTAWSVMRSIANVAFVIVFLIIIFSQLTSAGVSNYGVKKLLPRLIVGAILVNLSYFICAIAVDLSNILGVAVQDVFDKISTQAANTGKTGDNWGSITTSILSGGVVTIGAGLAIETLTAGGIWGAVTALVPLLVGALFALVVAFLILLARQALIIMLIVVAPLAFVAFLLPNTEDLFKKWQKLFTTLLVLFPLLSLVFAGSMLASVILRSTAGATLSGKTDGSDFIALCLYIGSFAVQAIPFFITPLLINLSSGVLGRFAGLVNNKNKGPFDRLRKGGERIAKDAQNRSFANKVNAGGIRNFGARRRARIGRVSSGLEGTAKYNENEYVNSQLSTETGKLDANGNSKLATRMAAGDIKGGASISAKAIASTEQEHLKEAMQPLLRTLSTKVGSEKTTHLQQEIDQAKLPGGDQSRASAALHYAAQIGDTKFLREQLKSGGETERMTREAINANPSSIIGKAPDLVKGAGAAFGSLKGEDIVQFKPDTAEAFVAHIQGLAETASRTSDPRYASDPAFKVEVDKAAASYKTAVNGFNSAVQDVQNSPEFQAKFSGEVGSKIQQTIMDVSAANPTLTIQHDLHTGIVGIQADGKIR